MDKPKVSVLMPVYNTKEEYLREAIESILNQTFTDFEFLILDDGSTDRGTIETINLYTSKDSRIKFLKGEHTGIGAARNKLIQAANSEICVYMDSDDISLPHRLETQFNFMNINKNIAICGTYFEHMPSGKIEKQILKPKFLDFLKGMNIGNPTLMFRKSYFEKYNLYYDESLSTSEDYELFSRAIKYMEITTIPEVLYKYRILENSTCHKNLKESFEADKMIRQNMLDFLTDDKELQAKMCDLVLPNHQLKYSFWERIFSLKNTIIQNSKIKVLTILGIQIKFKKYEKALIVRLMGGLGNQMFQYAFGQSLKKTTGKEVLYDNSWFEESKKNIINEKRENADGVVMREQCIDIFDININFASENQAKNCKHKVFETKEFEFDSALLKQRKSAIYEGYFQNEGYLRNIKDQIKKDFQFPKISENDSFNNTWLNKIHQSENPVFVHIRRGDYVNLGFGLSADYYKKAIEYIKEHVNNPTFFIFGQDCEEYIKEEFKDIDANFEIIGEENSKNKEDWKDIVLMEECKHAIIANSSFSWWAVWLGRANQEGTVIAPSPWLHKKDSIICDNWIKIKR